jgi:hypothetical protein
MGSMSTWLLSFCLLHEAATPLVVKLPMRGLNKNYR